MVIVVHHNFSGHSYSTWNNGYILFKNIRFFKEWFTIDIIWIKQLFNEEDLLFLFEKSEITFTFHLLHSNFPLW